MAGGAPKDVFQPVTDAVRTEVRTLIGEARHAALASLQPGSGHPLASRVGLACFADGTPLIFISALAAHTGALLADPRCSLLVGTPGKGDPLAHARVSILCQAEVITDAQEISAARKCYLAAHPKAQLYIDLPDFRFFRLRPLEASFNGGFGRGFRLEAADLLKLEPDQGDRRN